MHAGGAGGRRSKPSAAREAAEPAEGTVNTTGRTRTAVVSKISERAVAKDAALVVLYGQDLGRRFELGRAETIVGRSSRCDVQVDQESVSRRHAKLSRSGGGIVVRDLESTNGTLVNDQAVTEYELRNGDLIKIGRTIFKFIAGGNIEQLYHEEIYRLTTVDGLTQAYNRRYFLEQLARELGRCQRYGRRLTLGLFDVDDFKAVNDSRGHLAGDQVLTQLAAAVRGKIRREDIFARLGGDEFALALPELSLSQGLMAGEKLRKVVAKQEFLGPTEALHLTISMGMLEYRGKAIDAASLLRQADTKLYEAKRLGKNRVCS
ncbi:MAG TPA: GGDEF domain-containing protein [Myxococcales bacterium]|nr:GGDEF domain-containing protein [Myxococcales bacterium]